MSDNKIERIDVKRAFYSKNNRIARLLPNFFFNYLKKIVHQDEINDFLEIHGHKVGLDFNNAVISEFNVEIELIGEKNLPPKDGRYLFVSNHPLGGFDGIILMEELNKRYNSVKFLSNDILMNIKNLSSLFIPINKHGGQSRNTVEILDNAYSSDIQICSFPAGLVSRKREGVIRDLTWHKNFVVKAVQHKRDVVPIHVSGNNSSFFYRLSNIRKALGIKFNIEMLYLANELFKHKNKKFTITIGKPISYQTFDNSKKPAEWANEVKKQVYALVGETI
jgi:putative hemolysin